MNLPLFIAQATTPATGPATAPAMTNPWWVNLMASPFTLMILLLVVLLFFMQRGKKREQQKRDDLLANLKKGARIQTIGGAFGTIVEVTEQHVLVKVDESANVKIKFSRSAIHRVLGDEAKDGKDA